MTEADRLVEVTNELADINDSFEFFKYLDIRIILIEFLFLWFVVTAMFCLYEGDISDVLMSQVMFFVNTVESIKDSISNLKW
jgi:hypothetical protein